MDIERSIDIASPADTVWSVLMNIADWPQWNASVDSVECIDDQFPNLQSRVRLRQPRVAPAVWVVTVLESERYFEWQSTAIGVRTVGGHRLQSIPDGTRVILSIHWSGFLAPLVRRLFGDMSRRYVEMEAEGLKQRCEAVMG